MKKTKISLIEKNVDVISCFRSIIEKEKDMVVVSEEKDVVIALQQAITLKSDVIVLDMSLLDMGKNGLLSKIIASMPDVKVIVESMYSDSRFVIRMLHMGAKGYMLKDCCDTELVTAIRTVVANRMYFSPGIAGITKDNNILNN